MLIGLHACNLPSLELRRLQTDLLLCYKIIHNLVAINFNDLYQFDTDVYCTRGHKFKLKKPLVHNKIRKNFFSVRVILPWNSLPQDVVL